MKNRMATGVFLLTFLFLGACGRVHFQNPGVGANGHPSLHASSPGASSIDAPAHDQYSDRVLRLQKDLESMSRDVDGKEAFQIADVAIRYSMVLANQYELVSPPLLHNHLVNTGKKKRGLCFHWIQDLMKRLREVDQKSFDFRCGMAYSDSLLRIDHSSLIICAKGQSFYDGIVLDPWRDSGKLYWIPVKKDVYPWQPEPPKIERALLGE